jgi:hypothetical protein
MKRISAGEQQFQLLANQLARANTHYHFAKELHENHQKLGWAKDFWEYTLTAHCSIAFLDLCRVYDYNKDGLNLINCLQSIDKRALDQAKQNQLSFYIAECRQQSQNSLVKSLRTWRNAIIAHYNFEAAHDRDGFDKNNPDEPEKIIHSLIEMGFKILECCSGLQGKATIYQKFAPGKDDCEKVLNRLESCFM